MSIGTRNDVIAGCGMHHISIQTQDWDASLEFYQGVLGMELVKRFGPPEKPMVLLDIGDGSFIELVAPGPEGKEKEVSSGHQSLLHFALATTDIHGAVERVRKAGVEIVSTPREADLNGLLVTFAFIKGPNGEEIEFFQTHLE